MKNFIKNKVGNITLPCDAVRYYGRMYVPSSPCPYNYYFPTEIVHPFNYRQIKQNWYGRWVEVDCWLGLNSKIVN